jgi:hypothetical protein
LAWIQLSHSKIQKLKKRLQEMKKSKSKLKTANVIRSGFMSLSMMVFALSRAQGAVIDLGIDVLATDIFADATGAQLDNSASVFIGTWKSGYDTSTPASSVLADFRAGTKSISTLSTYFVIGISTTYGSLNQGGYNTIIGSDTGLANQPLDILAFSGSTSTTAQGLDYLAIRLDSVFLDSETTSRELNVGLVVPSLGADQAALFAGRLVDNGDGTGQFQTIPEPSSSALIAGAAGLFCLVRRFQRKV